jgi:hypothetical protein
MRPSALAFLVSCALVLSGCQALAATPPPPTPADFAGIVGSLGARGIGVEDVRTGDSGCSDPDLTGPGVSLSARGLDQPTSVPLHLYMFRNTASYEKLRAAVDACARAYVTDAATYESLDAVPFVLAGQGPWPTEFRSALQAAITEAAGEPK